MGDNGISMEIVDQLLDVDDPFVAAEAELKPERNRLKFIENELSSYIGPEAVLLSAPEDPIKKYYQHIDVKKTLKKMLEDPTYMDQQSEDSYSFNEDIISDIRDGWGFRRNKFFQENPDAVPLIIFQDELEITNPLGAGKTKHKINATYLTHALTIPALRSKVASVQLVSLVLSRDWKTYGNEACNRRLIEDIKFMEDFGITVEKPLTQNVKAGLAFMVITFCLLI